MSHLEEGSETMAEFVERLAATIAEASSHKPKREFNLIGTIAATALSNLITLPFGRISLAASQSKRRSASDIAAGINATLYKEFSTSFFSEINPEREIKKVIFQNLLNGFLEADKIKIIELAHKDPKSYQAFVNTWLHEQAVGKVKKELLNKVEQLKEELVPIEIVEEELSLASESEVSKYDPLLNWIILLSPPLIAACILIPSFFLGRDERTEFKNKPKVSSKVGEENFSRLANADSDQVVYAPDSPNWFFKNRDVTEQTQKQYLEYRGCEFSNGRIQNIKKAYCKKAIENLFFYTAEKTRTDTYGPDEAWLSQGCQISGTAVKSLWKCPQ